MKITIEVDNEEIEKNVTDLVSNKLAQELYKELRGSRDTSLTYRYHVEVRKIIREVLKDRMFHALEDDWKRMKELLKEQDERIKNLEHQLETITKWRANAGAFD